MIDTVYFTLEKIDREPRSLRTFVAQFARDTHDLGFLIDLDRFPEGRDILSFLAETETCRQFFDARHDDIADVLTDMRAA